MLTQRTYCLLILVIGLGAGHSLGQDNVSRGGPIGNKAHEIMQKMNKCLKGAEQFSFVAHDMIDEVLRNGQRVQLANTRKISVHRPNKVLAELSGDVDNERIWYDGAKLALLDKRLNSYAVIDVPDTIDKMLDFMVAKFGVTVPVADLLFSDPYAMVTANVRAGYYVGLHHVHGDPCHHIAFRQTGIDWQIWIDAGELPLPRKLVITYKDYPGQPQYMAFVSDWNLEPKLSDDMFAFHAPAGAKQVDMESLQSRRTVGRPPAAKNTNTGEGKTGGGQ